jgi:hypothetical protein
VLLLAVTMASSYPTLGAKSTQIRLLELLPLKRNGYYPTDTSTWFNCENIECNLTVYTLEQAPTYDALSYAWGSDEPTVPVTINGQNVLVRPNLAYALAALRNSKPRVLWIDALCIDQDNIHERNHQVRLMGAIYRQSEQVLVWLGRPKSGMDFLATGAFDLLRSFGECVPESNLPPAPPNPDVAQEEEFDQWVSTLQASYPIQATWTMEWGNQWDRWLWTKNNREWMRLRRERMAGLLGELFEPGQSLVTIRQESKNMKKVESEQYVRLKSLEIQDEEQQIRLESPQIRLLTQYKRRQEKVFESSGFTLASDHDEDVIEPEKEKNSDSNTSSASSTHNSLARKLYNQIQDNMGEFQRWVNDIPDKSRRERMKRLSDDERRAHGALKLQLSSWLGLEKVQNKALQDQRIDQDRALEIFIRRWDNSRQRSLYSLANWQEFELEQRRQLEELTLSQIQALENLKARHEQQWSLSSIYEPDQGSFLTESEIEILAGMRTIRRQQHEQLMALRLTALQVQTNERLSAQYGKWRDDVYEMARGMQSAMAEESQARANLLNAQAYWARHWEDLRENETKSWRDRLFWLNRRSKSLSDLFLGLSTFCNLPYWSRLWIVQEVLLAKELILCFGDNARTTQSWDVITQARSSLDQIPALWKLDASINTPIETLKQSLSFQLDRLREGNVRHWPLHKLLEITENSHCRDQKDKIYGLLGLASDCEAEDIDIDYSKTTKDVYHDVIRWYHQAHTADDGSPSIVRFSQTLQLSLRGSGGLPTTITGAASSTAAAKPTLPVEMLCTRGIMQGPILPLEQLLDDATLVRVRQRDWITVMIDYLDNSGIRKLRDRLEEEILHLSSVLTSFSFEPSTSAYATKDQPVLRSGNTTMQTLRATPANNGNGKEETPQFFIFNNAHFGVASARIREGDVLSIFQDSHLGLILRREQDRYVLVSKAILSQGSINLPKSALPAGDVSNPLKTAPEEAISTLTAGNPENLINIVFDSTSLQQLTLPFELSNKHRLREPACIHEADFGWYEFINFGIDSGVEPAKRPAKRRKVEPKEVSNESILETPPSEFTIPPQLDAVLGLRLDNFAMNWQPVESPGLAYEFKVDSVWNRTWQEIVT